LESAVKIILTFIIEQKVFSVEFDTYIDDDSDSDNDVEFDSEIQLKDYLRDLADRSRLEFSCDNIRFTEIEIVRGFEKLNFSSDLFEDFPDLKKIKLDYMSFSTLPEGIFRNLTQLKEIDLSYGQLQTLPKGIFEGLNNLIVIILDHNILECLPKDLFKDLPSLRVIFLRGNWLGDFPDFPETVMLVRKNNNLRLYDNGDFRYTQYSDADDLSEAIETYIAKHGKNHPAILEHTLFGTGKWCAHYTPDSKVRSLFSKWYRELAEDSQKTRYLFLQFVSQEIEKSGESLDVNLCKRVLACFEDDNFKVPEKKTCSIL